MLSAKIRTKWIIGRTKWIIEYFSYLALVEYRTKWIRIKWGPGVYGIWGSNSTTQQILLCSSLRLIAALAFGEKFFCFHENDCYFVERSEGTPVQSVSQHWKAFISFFPIGCLQGGVNMSQKLLVDKDKSG